jgi:3'-phosphoadenosine 5'-phosphosulfate sulfotransferase (PAPS reductase)/FAD synthetase
VKPSTVLDFPDTLLEWSMGVLRDLQFLESPPTKPPALPVAPNPALTLKIPPVIFRALTLGADFVLSCSGGKDSQGLMEAVIAWWRQHHFTGKIFAVFAHLGRIEWAGALEWCQMLCKKHGIQLVVVRREKGGLIDNFDERRRAIAKDVQAKQAEEKPHFPSPTARYCTARQKTSTSDTVLRNPEKALGSPHFPSPTTRYCTKGQKTQTTDKVLRSNNLIICAMGLRAEESTEREKQPVYQVRSGITTEKLKEPKGMKDPGDRQAWADEALDKWLAMNHSKKVPPRLAFNWNAIHDWKLPQVWAACGTSAEDIERRRALFRAGRYREALENTPVVWAYIAGSSRFSCSLCIMSSGCDRTVGAVHNVMTWRELAIDELDSGWSYQQGFALHSMAKQITQLPPEQRHALHRVLCALGLVHPLPGNLVLELLKRTRLEWLLFWLDAAWLELDQIFFTKHHD